ncbi:MAG TPA: hypothetical protein VIW94_11120 [Acidimicrobiia bacterium]
MTEEFVKVGKKSVHGFARWLSRRLEEAPDLEEVKDFAAQKSRQTVEMARDRVEELGSWLGDLAVEMNLVEPPKKSKSKQVAGGAAVAAVAAGSWYLFNPGTGKQHRIRIRNYFSSLRDRITGRIDDINFIADEPDDIAVVGERKVAGLEGVKNLDH